EGAVIVRHEIIEGTAFLIISVALVYAFVYQSRKRLKESNERLRKHEQMLEVLNRVLRHNLRNDINVIQGNAEFLKEKTADSKREEKAELIEEKCDEIIEKGEKSRKIEKLVEDDEMKRIDIVEILQRLVKDARDEYPDADFTVDLPDKGYVFAHKIIGIAVWNLIENAVEHNRKETPEVRISLSESPLNNGWTLVEVADNGSGIPEEEVEVIRRGRETALSHGSGLGLWITNWIVVESDGKLHFSENEPEGTVATIRLERASSPFEQVPYAIYGYGVVSRG
ncbi:MAG: HAMP domain-containing sensor histidine kinase, partial [Halobacteria archaeon]|nr:HAMP domain-containing sensor histidine kinase [Halobacteria archaeon]